MKAPEFRKEVLDNGATVVAERHPHVQSVCVGVWVKSGTCHESGRLNGISHFLEHMVFKGTQTRSPFEISSALECLGGDLNAFTDREYTVYHATVLAEDLAPALDVLSDLVLHPTFPKAEIDREKKVLLQEMTMVEESPEEWVMNLLVESVWKGEPLGLPILGTRRTIQRLGRAEMLRYFEEHYRADNVVISVAGNFDFGKLRELCERYFDFAPRQRELPLPPAPSRFKPRRRSVTADSDQVHVAIAYEGLGYKDPRRFDALVLSALLGGGMSSRLFQEIREKAALAYSVDCDFVAYGDAGLVTFYVAVAPRSFRKCLDILGMELEKVRGGDAGADELSKIKGQLKGTLLLSADLMESRQESIGRNEVIFGRYVSVDEVLKAIEQVTPEKVARLASDLFVPEKEAVATIGRNRYRNDELRVL